MRIKSLPLVVATGCFLVASACQTTRTAGTTTPPAPSGRIQTTSSDGDRIPAGTVLAVRTNESIQTDTAGDVYAIVGGAKGAAIGAAAGAAGGAAAQVLTRGDEVRVPTETVLSFQIQGADRADWLSERGRTQ